MNILTGKHDGFTRHALEDDRNEKYRPLVKVTNPDFRIGKEIYEAKGTNSISGKSSIASKLIKANKQIKNSGYDMPTYTDDQQPQGIASLQFIEKELKLSLRLLPNQTGSRAQPD